MRRSCTTSLVRNVELFLLIRCVCVSPSRSRQPARLTTVYMMNGQVRNDGASVAGAHERHLRHDRNGGLQHRRCDHLRGTTRHLRRRRGRRRERGGRAGDRRGCWNVRHTHTHTHLAMTKKHTHTPCTVGSTVSIDGTFYLWRTRSVDGRRSLLIVFRYARRPPRCRSHRID